MKHVLVVEDEPSIARIFQFHLERQGHRATVVGDGEAALAAVETRRPDLIVLDLLLPKLDGWAVAERLKAAPATTSIPVLMVSIVADRDRGLASGAADYLTKPFAVEDFVAKVERLLR
jgi:DNA-binding response OmpR family regulator